MATGPKKRERTCIGCGAKAGKTQLFRLVRSTDGSVRFDATGRLAGRGAYVCSPACLDVALKAGKLQRALRVSVGSEDAERAVSEIRAEASALTS